MRKQSLARGVTAGLLLVFTACSTKMPGEWKLLDTGTSDAFYSVNFVNERVGYINAVADRDFVPLGEEAKQLANQNANQSANQNANRSPAAGNGNAAKKGEKKVDPLKANEGFEVLRTTDGGDTWNQLPEQFKHRIRSVWFVDEQNGWALTIDRDILRTTDGANTWTLQRKAGKVKVKLVANRREPISEQPEQIDRVHFVDLNTGWAWGGGRKDEYAEQPGVFLTTIDGGQNWSEVTYPFEQNVWSIFFLNARHAWANTPDGSFYRTTDGGLNWETVKTTMPEDRLDAIFFRDENNGWVATHSGRLAKTTDSGKTWTKMWKIEKKYVMRDVYFTDPNHGWAAGDKGIILYTDDGGEDWVFLNPVGEVDYRDIQFLNKDRGWVVGLSGALLRHEQ